MKESDDELAGLVADFAQTNSTYLDVLVWWDQYRDALHQWQWYVDHGFRAGNPTNIEPPAVELPSAVHLRATIVQLRNLDAQRRLLGARLSDYSVFVDYNQREPKQPEG